MGIEEILHEFPSKGWFRSGFCGKLMQEWSADVDSTIWPKLQLHYSQAVIDVAGHAIEYLIRSDNIIVLVWYFNFDEKYTLICRFYYALIRVTYISTAAYLFGHLVGSRSERSFQGDAVTESKQKKISS